MGNQELGERLMGVDGEATRVVPIVPTSPAAKPKPTWDALEEEEQERHTEADSPERSARMEVAEVRSREAEVQLELKKTKKELALAQAQLAHIRLDQVCGWVGVPA